MRSDCAQTPLFVNAADISSPALRCVALYATAGRLHELAPDTLRRLFQELMKLQVSTALSLLRHCCCALLFHQLGEWPAVEEDSAKRPYTRKSEFRKVFGSVLADHPVCMWLHPNTGIYWQHVRNGNPFSGDQLDRLETVFDARQRASLPFPESALCEWKQLRRPDLIAITVAAARTAEAAATSSAINELPPAVDDDSLGTTTMALPLPIVSIATTASVTLEPGVDIGTSTAANAVPTVVAIDSSALSIDVSLGLGDRYAARADVMTPLPVVSPLSTTSDSSLAPDPAAIAGATPAVRVVDAEPLIDFLLPDSPTGAPVSPQSAAGESSSGTALPTNPP